jgi:hypothetical protein
MRTTAITPHITVAIGQQARLYHAYITAAPATVDAPSSTMTLYVSTVTDRAGFANRMGRRLDDAMGATPCSGWMSWRHAARDCSAPIRPRRTACSSMSDSRNEMKACARKR